MCCILFSDAPVEGPRYTHINAFEVPLSRAPCDGMPSVCWCLLQCFPLTAPCAQVALRRKVLGGNMKEYSCCQGYFSPCGAASTQHRRKNACETRFPSTLLCLEAFFCNCYAVSASRMLVMDKFDLRPDPIDNQIIRCNNCIAGIACACDVAAALCCSDLRRCARCLDLCAQLSYCLVSGCMTAQTALEVDYQTKACLARHVSSISDAFVLTDKEQDGYSEFIEAGKHDETKDHDVDVDAFDGRGGYSRGRSHRRQQQQQQSQKPDPVVSTLPPAPDSLSSPML